MKLQLFLLCLSPGLSDVIVDLFKVAFHVIRYARVCGVCVCVCVSNLLGRHVILLVHVSIYTLVLPVTIRHLK